MTLVVDPPLSVTDILKLADDIRATLKTTLPHWRAYMWKRCRSQAGRDLIIIHTPNINTPSLSRPPSTRCRHLSVGASSPMKRSRSVHLDSCGCAFYIVVLYYVD
jgi:hypothetical protein